MALPEDKVDALRIEWEQRLADAPVVDARLDERRRIAAGVRVSCALNGGRMKRIT